MAISNDNASKYRKHYKSLIEKAQKRESVDGVCERHHIIPLGIGGDNTADNIVKLTPKEHYVAHHLLSVFCPCSATHNAFWLMCWTRKDRIRIPARTYAKAKESLSEYMKKRHSGAKNHWAKRSIDHTGSEFGSQKEMCDYWNISQSLFSCRINRYSWSIKRALTTPANGGHHRLVNPIDHTGRVFKTTKEMCQWWKVSPGVFTTRIRSGASVMESLTGTNIKACIAKGLSCVDFEGNKFSSQVEMADYWNVGIKTLRGRLSRGWCLEEALTRDIYDKGNGHEKKCKDHKGNEFRSETERARYWGIPRDTYKVRRTKCGWSVEKSLTTPVRRVKSKDLHVD